jgi:hypothetical protein
MNYRRTLPFASAILVVQAQAPAPPPTALAAPAAATSASQAAPVTGAQAGAGEGVQRSIRTINYRLIKSTTRIDFQNATGTAGVEGRAKIKCKGGITLIKAKFTGLPVPSAFGRANLTYVLWAVSPEGRAVSLGELQVKHGRAKVAGVLASHKALRIQVEGFTDSTGTAQVNQRLSEERALAAKDFLVGQGVPEDAISAKGFGPANPVADNASVSGRQENRRVELVVSGEGITGPNAPEGTQP